MRDFLKIILLSMLCESNYSSHTFKLTIRTNSRSLKKKLSVYYGTNSSNRMPFTELCLHYHAFVFTMFETSLLFFLYTNSHAHLIFYTVVFIVITAFSKVLVSINCKFVICGTMCFVAIKWIHFWWSIHAKIVIIIELISVDWIVPHKSKKLMRYYTVLWKTQKRKHVIELN